MTRCDTCDAVIPPSTIVGRVAGYGDVCLKVCRSCVEARVETCRTRQANGDLSDLALLDGALPRTSDIWAVGPVRWSSLADQLRIDRTGVLVNDLERRVAS